MKNYGQLLIEVLIGLIILSFLSLILFLIFNAWPKFVKSIDDSIIIYNRALNYQSILIGLSRTNFSQFDNLVINQPYHFSPTSSGYEIKIGKDNFENDYYQWFQIDENKLIKVYIQTPTNLYSFNFQLANIKEKIFVQDKWEIATTAIIDLTVNTSVNQYYDKSQNIQINGQIQLSQ